jgi:hypothetical protein
MNLLWAAVRGVSWRDNMEGIETARWIDASVGRLFSGVDIWKDPILVCCSPMISTEPGVPGQAILFACQLFLPNQRGGAVKRPKMTGVYEFVLRFILLVSLVITHRRKAE